MENEDKLKKINKKVKDSIMVLIVPICIISSMLINFHFSIIKLVILALAVALLIINIIKIIKNIDEKKLIKKDIFYPPTT